jgi:hypothetical protein
MRSPLDAPRTVPVSSNRLVIVCTVFDDRALLAWCRYCDNLEPMAVRQEIADAIGWPLMLRDIACAKAVSIHVVDRRF